MASPYKKTCEATNSHMPKMGKNYCRKHKRSIEKHAKLENARFRQNPKLLVEEAQHKPLFPS